MNTTGPLSDDLKDRMESSLHKINAITLINNKKIREFRAKSSAMPEDLQSLATIVSGQVAVLEEKYKLIYDLVTDLYTRIETTPTESRDDYTGS